MYENPSRAHLNVKTRVFTGRDQSGRIFPTEAAVPSCMDLRREWDEI